MAKTTRKEHIRTLERRRDYLLGYLTKSPENPKLSYVRAEFSALNWAVINLRELMGIFDQEDDPKDE